MAGMYVLRVKVDWQFPLPPSPNYSYISLGDKGNWELT